MASAVPTDGQSALDHNPATDEIDTGRISSELIGALPPRHAGNSSGPVGISLVLRHRDTTQGTHRNSSISHRFLIGNAPQTSAAPDNLRHFAPVTACGAQIHFGTPLMRFVALRPH